MPALIQLLRADPDFPRLRLAILLTLSAIAGGGFLIALNLAIDEIAASQPNPQTWLVLMLATHLRRDSRQTQRITDG
jgi:hypothetical protein